MHLNRNIRFRLLLSVLHRSSSDCLTQWCNGLVAVVCKCLVRPWGLIARKIDVKILEQCLFGLRMKLLIARYMSAGTVCCLYKGRCSSKCRAEHDIRSGLCFVLWFLLMLQGYLTNLNVGSENSTEKWFVETWIRATPVVFPELSILSLLSKMLRCVKSPIRLVPHCH